MVTIENRSESEIPLVALGELLSRVTREKTGRKIAVYLVGNEEIRGLNRQFFGKDRPTNVISFPSGGGSTMLGEIVVSVDYCLSETGTTGLDLEQLITYYFTHGLLHLLGYEHVHGGREEKRMIKEERRLFSLAFPGIELEDEA